MDPTSFQTYLHSRTTPLVVDVWAPWCMPCRAISPALEQLSQEYSGRVELFKINADESPELVRSLGIFGIPTLLVFQGEKEIVRRTGAQPLEQLRDLFEAGLAGEAPPRRGPGLRERLLRLSAGGALLMFGMSRSLALNDWVGAHSLLLLAGAVVMFTAVYDRCPIWQAITARLTQKNSGA